MTHDMPPFFARKIAPATPGTEGAEEEMEIVLMNAVNEFLAIAGKHGIVPERLNLILMKVLGKMQEKVIRAKTGG